jgi:hypothetical protein
MYAHKKWVTGARTTIRGVNDEASNGSEPADNGSDPDDNRTAFERLEDLTRRLVAVPKAEVDALREKEKKARQRAAARRRT